jgi:hypothetical protein
MSTTKRRARPVSTYPEAKAFRILIRNTGQSIITMVVRSMSTMTSISSTENAITRPIATKENYEYMKEVNKLSSCQSTYWLKNSIAGDCFQVNKGFVMGMTDDDDEVESYGNKYSFLVKEISYQPRTTN